MKPLKIILTLAVLIVMVSACAPSAEPVIQSEPLINTQESNLVHETSELAPLAAETQTAELKEIIVQDVSIQSGVGSPIPVEAVVAGDWPGLCSQLARVEQQSSGTTFDIRLLATADTPDCRPDLVGLPFRLAIPLNMVEKPEGSYTVTVNGVTTTFDWNQNGLAPTTAPTEASRFSYEGVSFVLDSAVAASASGERIAENPGTPDGPYWDALPEHIKISLSGYPLSGKMFEPVISVYPVDDYRRLSEQAGKEIDELAWLLDWNQGGRPAGAEGENAQIPFLPIWNAGQSFHSNAQYLDFENGAGVRFLAVYSQYPAPVNNHDLFYTFQGLTSDGRYVVSVIMPVSHPSLAETAEALSTEELQTIADTYGDYRLRMSATMQELPNDTFTTDLWKLDQLVSSLQIE